MYHKIVNFYNVIILKSNINDNFYNVFFNLSSNRFIQNFNDKKYNNFLKYQVFHLYVIIKLIIL